MHSSPQRSCLSTHQKSFIWMRWVVFNTNHRTRRSRFASLNKHHAYFLLVDNGTVGKYGAEIALRRKLEKFISTQCLGKRSKTLLVNKKTVRLEPCSAAMFKFYHMYLCVVGFWSLTVDTYHKSWVLRQLRPQCHYPLCNIIPLVLVKFYSAAMQCSNPPTLPLYSEQSIIATFCQTWVLRPLMLCTQF